VTYRLYTASDFAALYGIEEVCFQRPLRFGLRYMRELVGNPDGATWIAEEAGRMAGFAIVEWETEASGVLAYIQTIEVAPDWRGRGVGGELLRCMEASARGAGALAIWLHVDAENAVAIRLYRAHGYFCRGKQEDYYARGRAALVYAKMLMEILQDELPRE
jgi:ribosomal-protein-alanine N-acetyltransferase